MTDVDEGYRLGFRSQERRDIAEAYKRLKWVLDETGLDNDLRAVKAADLRIILNALGGMK